MKISIVDQDVDTSTDVLIIGGGLVGASLALALSRLNLRVSLVEKKFLPLQVDASAILDQRALALNLGTLNIFKSLFQLDLSVLGALVQHIYVSDQKGFGRIQLEAKDEALPYFGCVIPILRLTQKLQALVFEDPNITCISGECVGLSQDESIACCELNDGRFLRARLVLAADGASSRIREFLNIGIDVKDYGQVALIANVRMQGVQVNAAYERFTVDGPLALLPFDQEHMTLVWVMSESVARMRQKLPHELLLKDLQAIMGYRAGRFLELGSLQAFPLKLVLAQQTYRGRIGLLGNAAHSLHPVAGQGFNLSVRDVFAFYQTLQRYHDCLDTPECIWQEYLSLRLHDQERTRKITDGLIQLFTKKNLFYGLLRNSLMLNLEFCPMMKSALNEVMVGLT